VTIDQASGNLRISAGFVANVIPPTRYVLTSGPDYTSGDLIVGVGGDFKVLRATVSPGWSANATTAFSLLTTSASNVRVNSAGIGYSAVTPLTNVQYFAGNTSYILTFQSDVTFLSDWNVSAIDMTVSGANIVNDNLVFYTGGVANTQVLQINGANRQITAFGNLAMNGGAIANTSAISATGNVTGGNVNTAGLISATGNVNAGNVQTGNLSLSGNVLTAINSTSDITTTANITGGNIITGGFVSVTGNISGANVISTSTLSATGDVRGGSITALGPFGFGGDITAGGLISATGNITGANIVTAGSVSATGNITGNYFIGNGSQLTGVALNGPAFSAYANATLQTITSGSQQKVLFQTEEYDTNNNYANSRFTPTVAGYYQLNAQVRLDGASGTGEIMVVIWKNGAEYKRGTNQSGTQIASSFWAMQVSSLVYANGTSDYFEIYVQQTSGSSVTVTAVNSVNITWFNGTMIRGA